MRAYQDEIHNLPVICLKNMSNNLTEGGGGRGGVPSELEDD